jgi:hypothetical protein
MSEQDQGFAPTDPAVEDDLLTPEHEQEPSEQEELGEVATPEDEFDGAETESARGRRPFVRLAWAAMVVFAVVGLLMVAELFRISTALSNNACIQLAQAELMETLGPGVTPPYAGLDRLIAVNQLHKCGQ